MKTRATDRPPPTAPKRSVINTAQGDTRTDEYTWLRDKSEPEVLEHLRAEDAHAEAWMAPTRELQKRLYDEMLTRIQESDVSVPYRRGRFCCYARAVAGMQYAILCRKDGHLEAPETVILDMNAMAEGHGFFALGEFEVSDDGSELLFSTDTSGYREYTLQRKDLRTGEISPWRVERVSSGAWAADDRTLFYVEDDPVSKRPYRLRCTRPGVPCKGPSIQQVRVLPRQRSSRPGSYPSNRGGDESVEAWEKEGGERPPARW